MTEKKKKKLALFVMERDRPLFASQKHAAAAYGFFRHIARQRSG